MEREEPMALHLLFAFVVVLSSYLPAKAQSFPARSVTIVVSSTAGSLPDLLARGVGQELHQKWKQPVVIENRAGGAYAIAANAVTSAPADGYTLLATESGLYTIQPHLSKSRAYDAQRDFVPVAGMASIPLAFVAVFLLVDAVKFEDFLCCVGEVAVTVAQFFRQCPAQPAAFPFDLLVVDLCHMPLMENKKAPAEVSRGSKIGFAV